MITPGPWIVVEDRYIDAVRPGKKNKKVGETGVPGCVLSKQDIANAQAIAALPELIEAGKAVLNWLPIHNDTEAELFEMLDAALTKAGVTI